MEIVVILFDGFIGWVFFSLCTWHSLASFRKSQHAHWTLRANVLAPARTGARVSLFLVPVIIGYIQADVFELSLVANWSGAAASFVGVVLGTFQLERVVFPDIKFRTWWFHAVIARSRVFVFYASFLIAMKLMPLEPGMQMVMITFVFIAVQTVLLVTVGRGRISSLGVNEPVEERFRALVSAACEKAGRPIPRLRQLKNRYAAAWAVPIRNEIAVTDGLLNACTDPEIDAVIHHELAHLSESHRDIAIRTLSAYHFAPMILIGPVGNWLGGLGPLFLFGAVYFLVRLHINHHLRLELLADEKASEMALDPTVYATALYKIHRTNLTPALNTSVKVGHPDLYDRMISAGLEPDFPKPPRPEGITAFWVLAWTGLALVLMLLSIPKTLEKIKGPIVAPTYDSGIHSSIAPDQTILLSFTPAPVSGTSGAWAPRPLPASCNSLRTR